MNKQIAKYEKQYKDALLKDVIPFWEKHSLDKKHGGYFTCLDRKGKVFDTDKFVWLQGREAWLFAMLYNKLEKKAKWLKIAETGIEFLKKHGRDEKGWWYFSLTREGKPITIPFSIFSDCFAAMAFSQYALATGEEESKTIALTTYNNVLNRWNNPGNEYTKAYPGTRPLKALAVPMIITNLTLELDWMLPQKKLNNTIDKCLSEIMTQFYDRKKGLLFEHVAPDGTRPDSFECRLINPGHTIEAMWFVMDAARRKNDLKLIDKALDIIFATLEAGWDKKYGGIFYFLDSKGNPPQQLEWDQKLWWVHLETLVALIMGYSLTGRKECLQWFEKVHKYSWSKFPDPKYGEWWGYLNRKGEVLLNLKGGKWKGCFHVPRALYMCYLELHNMIKK